MCTYLHLSAPICTWYRRLGTKYLVPSTPGSSYQELGTIHLVPRTWYQVHQVLGTKCLVPFTWYHSLGTKYLDQMIGINGAMIHGSVGLPILKRNRNRMCKHVQPRRSAHICTFDFLNKATTWLCVHLIIYQTAADPLQTAADSCI